MEVLCWPVEFAGFLCSGRDGLIDWSGLPQVLLIAVNDAFLLSSFVYAISREHFNADECYVGRLGIVL